MTPTTFLRIRDAVHGDIELDREILVPLMDTPTVQRLRGIKQLGTAYLVYPSAVHTRFEHSLGTAWMAARLLEAIARQTGQAIPERERRAALAAALLHDITHIPFGHTFEDERRIFERHDHPERTRRFLREGPLAAVLERLGLAADVEAVLTGGPRAGLRPFVSEIVSAAVGADLLDYLARDAYFCGLRVGWDERVPQLFGLDESGRLALTVHKQGLLRADALSEIVNLLRVRYFLSERVYYHHAKLASGAMISKAVELAVGAGLTLEQLFPLEDGGLFFLLRERYGDVPGLAELLDALAARALYKRAYVLTPRVGKEAQQGLIQRFHLDRVAREAAERQLGAALGLAPGELIIYCPSARMAQKAAQVRVEIGPGRTALLSEMGLADVEHLLRKHEDLWRFYVFVRRGDPRLIDRLGPACEDFFCLENELARLSRGQHYFGYA